MFNLIESLQQVLTEARAIGGAAYGSVQLYSAACDGLQIVAQ